jgi:uncharacterized membrane protein YeaQ/YmgE (transglycosylase-associated protein family)
MTLVGLLVLLLIAALAGALGQALAGYRSGNFLVSMLFGFLGAIVGVWLARELGLRELLPVTIEGETFPVFWATVGAALLAAIAGLMFGGRRAWRR